MCLACEVAIEGQGAIEKAQVQYIENPTYNNSANSSY